MKKQKLISIGLVAAMVASLTACGGNGGNGDTQKSANKDVPKFDSLKVGEDYKDLKADIKILTNRTDICDTVYKEYAKEFQKMYPDINITYEGITDYDETVTLRLTNGDWGDICFIPNKVDKSEFANYFTELGDLTTMDAKYNYMTEKAFDDKVYGIPNGGTAGGVAYNKAVWKAAGITELPKTPDEFLNDLKKIKDNTDAIPLYTNFSAGWTMGAWNDYVGIASNGDPDYKNNGLLHQKNPFTKNDENSGPYAVYYTLYNAVSNKLVEDDPASSDWESSKTKINNGEIATMVLGSWCVQQFKDAGDHADDIGYMPFPISVNGKQSAAAGGNYAYAVNKEASTDNQIASMLYIKWLIEDSTIFDDEGSIPEVKGKDLPAALSEFNGVELLSNNAAVKGEEDLYDKITNDAEVLSGNDPVCEVLEGALYGNATLDDIMNEWNDKWTSAQESNGVEVK